MEVRFRMVGFLCTILTGWGAHAADTSGIKLNPGERIVAINGVPVEQLGIAPDGTRMGGGSPSTSAVVTASASVTKQASVQPAAYATNIVGNLVRTGQSFSHTPGESALDKANYERRMRGMGALTPDPALQELALQKATIAAARGYKNHIGGSLGGARAEGVGHTNGRFLSCCLDMPATYGGAAMVQGRDGWYCCLLVR
jgi:hypothetical protein